MKKRLKLRKKFIKPLLFVLSGFFIILIIVFGFYYILELGYQEKIFPGAYVGNINLSGKTVEEARMMINQKIDNFAQEGIVFSYDSKNIYIYPVSSSADGEMAENLISFNSIEAINKSFQVGRSGVFWKDFLDRLKLILLQQKNTNYLSVKLENEKILKIIENELSDYRYKNASYYLDSAGGIGIYPEVKGKRFYYDGIVLERQLSELNFSKINLVDIEVVPEILASDCAQKKEEVSNLLTITPITLKYKDGEWFVEKKDLLDWIFLVKNEESKNISIQLNKEKIVSYLNEKIFPYIGIRPIMPKFSVENGRVKNFEPGKEGFELDVELASSILVKIPETKLNRLELETKVVNQVSDVKSEDGFLLGIKEIIGSSALAFGSSSSSRVKNVKNGASKIDGVLIKPGEEFSAIKTLGSIDEKNGFVKEAVINGKVITKELGGGLCHLSTTMFRTVLSSGLPVTMRQNHSYSMSYYSPAGTDAAIYDPSPDFRFVNDTAYYVLVKSWVANGELVIQLWSTKDGRSVVRTKPVSYNIVRPKEARMIKSNTMASGVVSCSYAAYLGLDAYFDYKVTYPDGTLKVNRFYSHYVPRQGICYVGE